MCVTFLFPPGLVYGEWPESFTFLRNSTSLAWVIVDKQGHCTQSHKLAHCHCALVIDGTSCILVLGEHTAL